LPDTKADAAVKALAGVLAAIALLPTAGCVPLAVGGAAAGGYFVGQDERPPGVIASDGRITTAIKARYLQDKYVDVMRISVETYEGVVTLRGEVTSALPREQAERLASTVEGVKSVRNEIKIVRQPAK
jgi:hyperosmotically inducible periplasmic protein